MTNNLKQRERKIERVIAEQRDTKNFDYQRHKFK